MKIDLVLVFWMDGGKLERSSQKCRVLVFAHETWRWVLIGRGPNRREGRCVAEPRAVIGQFIH